MFNQQIEHLNTWNGLNTYNAISMLNTLNAEHGHSRSRFYLRNFRT
jgi:hypothetical protein